MRSRSVWKLAVLVSTATACSAQPSTKDLTKELKTVTSWAATAHLVGDSWLQGTVPNSYAKQTLQTTQEKIQTEVKTLAKVTPDRNREIVLNNVQQLQQNVGEMAKAVAQKDSTTLTQKIQELSDREREIQVLIKRIGEEP